MRPSRLGDYNTLIRAGFLDERDLALHEIARILGLGIFVEVGVNVDERQIGFRTYRRIVNDGRSSLDGPDWSVEAGTLEGLTSLRNSILRVGGCENVRVDPLVLLLEFPQSSGGS